MQAAGRQLGIATELYFHESDRVAIHTLVAASYNIIRDVSRHKGAPDMAVKDLFPTTVSAAQRKRVENWLNSFENFFKHADRDPDGTIKFNGEITELMLIDAWAQYERLGGTLSRAGKIFKLWTGNLKEGTLPEIATVASVFKRLPKRQFYESLLPFFQPET